MTGEDRDLGMNDEHLDLEEELGAYLLGALSPEESRRVEQMLDSSEPAREKLDWMKPAVDLLAETVQRREPAPELRERILGEVSASLPAKAESARAPRERRSWFRIGGLSLQPAAAMAVVVLVVGIAFAGYQLGTDGGSTTYQGQSAKLTVDGDDGILQLTGVANPPPNQEYQAWVQRGSKLLPSSPIAVRKNGTASVAIPHDLDGAEAVVVTTEPAGGSRTPTGPVLTSVQID